MTREEIIEGLKLLEDNMVYFDELLNDKGERIDVHELLFEAIEVLKQEPILDKIKTEILEEKEHAYADFERYKVEYLGQDQEDVLDSLPQDDFRYGMERTIEIIDNYRAESEDKNERRIECNLGFCYCICLCKSGGSRLWIRRSCNKSSRFYDYWYFALFAKQYL